MSKIIEKTFDAGKKIIRSIFKGSPNLLTSSDVNRQMEAFKHQMDLTDDRTGVTSDMEITHSLSSATLSVNCKYSYIRFKGCSFSPKIPLLFINFTPLSSTAYLCLVANTEVVTYEDDFTHDIAGAKFEDGTTMPAANQLRYKNEQVVLVHGISSLNNLVGVLAKFTLTTGGNVVVQRNIVRENESLGMADSKVIQDYNPSLVGAISNGRTYDEAFSILENRFSNLSPTWDYLTMTSSGGIVTPTNIAFRVQNGFLYLNAPEITFNRAIGKLVYRLGEFPANKKASLISLLKAMELESYGNFINPALVGGALCVPYGEFGCFPVANEATDAKTFGMAKVSLFLEYEQTDTVYSLKDVYIGAYVTGLFTLNFDNQNIKFEGVTGTQMASPGNEQVHIHRFIGAVPLFR